MKLSTAGMLDGQLLRTEHDLVVSFTFFLCTGLNTCFFFKTILYSDYILFNLDFHEMQDVHELYIKSFIDRKPNCGNILHTRNQVINFAIRMYSFGISINFLICFTLAM